MGNKRRVNLLRKLTICFEGKNVRRYVGRGFAAQKTS